MVTADIQKFFNYEEYLLLLLLSFLCVSYCLHMDPWCCPNRLEVALSISSIPVLLENLHIFVNNPGTF